MNIIKKIFSVISITTAALICLSLPYSYINEFGSLSKYSWHNDQSWANFGSFIGGTIGPLLSFIAILLVLISLREQRKLQETAEIQNLIFHDLEELSRLFNTVVNSSSIFINIPKLQFKSIIRNHGVDIIKGEEKNTAFINETAPQAFLIMEQIRHICWCFDKYLELGGNKDVISSYKNRLCVDVMIIYHCYGYNDPIVLRHFNIENMIKVFLTNTLDIEEIWRAAYEH